MWCLCYGRCFDTFFFLVEPAITVVRLFCVISGFCRKVAENWALLGYYHYSQNNNPKELSSQAHVSSFISSIDCNNWHSLLTWIVWSKMCLLFFHNYHLSRVGLVCRTEFYVADIVCYCCWDIRNLVHYWHILTMKC